MAEEQIYKQFIGKSEVDEAERTVTAIISTGVVDRENEVLLAKGADFEQFLKNPVVLWAHNYFEQPIGRAMWIKRGTKKITAKMQFADTQYADEIYELFRGGFLNAFSVGFRVLEFKYPTSVDLKKNPQWAKAERIITKWELLEFSVAPVPVNPEALVLAVKTKTLKLSPLTDTTSRPW